MLTRTTFGIPLADIAAFPGKTVEGMVPTNGIRRETEPHL